MPAALAASSTPNYVQVGGADVQGPDHIEASVPESSHHATWQHVDSTLDHNQSIIWTVRQYNICQVCSGHLELSAKNSY